jgi:hypothetical protein
MQKKKKISVVRISVVPRRPPLQPAHLQGLGSYTDFIQVSERKRFAPMRRAGIGNPQRTSTLIQGTV